MAQPFVGEIRMFAGNFAPSGWLFCDGSLQSIAANEVLFTLIGTTYGGDGVQTFALPDLRGRVPVHQGNGAVIGQMAGEEQVTLGLSQLPSHSHTQVASAAPASAAATASGNLLAASSAIQFYGPAPGTAMASGALDTAGGGQPHDNMAPFLTLSFIIAQFGIFPSQN